MKINFLILKMFLMTAILLSIAGTTAAQTLMSVNATNPTGNTWKLQIRFDKSVAPDKISGIKIFDLEFVPDPNDPTKNASVPLDPHTQTPVGSVYEVFTKRPLETKLVNNVAKLKPYTLSVRVEDAEGNADYQSIRIGQPPIAPVNKSTIAKASDIDDTDVYVDGEFQGAFKKKSSFSTNIKLQKTTKRGNWKYTPLGFFKLNASTDADADPDSMEFGFNFRYSFSEASDLDLDNEAKIESERDFGNTNLIFSSRLRYLPAGYKLGEITQRNGDRRPVQLFFRPYIGTELGKNIRSPLNAAEGDMIARVLIGANLRFNYPINREKGKDIDWTTSYARRWLFTDELGFDTDDDGNLQLVRFGKSPRDYFKSNVNYNLNKLFGFFVGYEWGQLPPSYKFVNHRFRVGFAYKFKFVVD